MAERKIWKFSKFDGGINNYTDPKDIKSNEFVELDDCNISKIGVIKTMGKALRSFNVSPGAMFGTLIPGKGLYNYFSDNSYITSDENHNSVYEVKEMVANSVSFGKTKFRPVMNGEGNMHWLFTGNPTGGTLKISVQYRDNDGGYHPIHGELDGTGTSLTVLKGTDWSSLDNSTGTDPSGDVNLLNKYTYYNYDSSDPFAAHSDIGGPYPVELWEQGDETAITQVWQNNETSTPGNFWEVQSNSFSGSDGYEEFVYNNYPNIGYGIHMANDGEWQDWFWDNSLNPGVSTGEWYWGGNDNRHIFGLNPGVNDTSYKSIGYAGIDPTNYWGDDVFWLGSDDGLPYDDIEWLAHANDDTGEGSFPFVNVNNSNLLPDDVTWEDNLHVFGQLVNSSIWSHIIQAINTFSGNDIYDRFSARFQGYNYWSGDVQNELPHFTDVLRDHIIISGGNEGDPALTGALNGGHFKIFLTAENILPVDGSELITDAQDRDFSSGSGSLGDGDTDIHWREYTPDSTALSGSDFQIDSGKLDVNKVQTNEKKEGAELLAEHFTTLVAGNHYRISAKIYSGSGTMTHFYIELGGRTIGPFDITTSTTAKEYVIEATEDSSLKIYSRGISTAQWYIDDVSIKQSNAAFIGDDTNVYDTGIKILGGEEDNSLGDDFHQNDDAFYIDKEDAKFLQEGERIRLFYPDDAGEYSKNEEMHIDYMEIELLDDGNYYARVTCLREDGWSGLDSEYLPDNLKARHQVSSDGSQTRIYKRRTHSFGDSSTPDGGNENEWNQNKRIGSPWVGEGVELAAGENHITDGEYADMKDVSILYIQGPDFTGDTLKVYLEGGTDYTDTGLISERINSGTVQSLTDLIIYDINSISGLSANTNGPEMIKETYPPSGSADSRYINRTFTNYDGIYDSDWQRYGSTNYLSSPVLVNDGTHQSLKVHVHTATATAATNILSGLGTFLYSNHFTGANQVIDNNGISETRPFKAGKTYIVKFEAKATAGFTDNYRIVTSNGSVSGNTYFNLSQDRYHAWASDAFSLTTSWASYSVEVSLASSAASGVADHTTVSPTSGVDTSEDLYGGFGSQIVEETRLNLAILNSSNATGIFYIDNISVKEKEFSRESDGYPYNTRTITVTADASTDTSAFALTLDTIHSDFGEGGPLQHGVSEEFTLLLNKSGVVPIGAWWDDINPEDGGTYYQTYFNLFTGLNKTWIGGVNDILEWYYSSTQDNNPIFWDEASRLRISEANFVLNNETKCLDYYDITNWFNDAININWDTYSESVRPKGFSLSTNNKKWIYSTTTTDINGSGLYTKSDIAITEGFENPSMRLYIRKDSVDQDGVDWTGTAKFYAAAVYDDGGEGLIGHKFSGDIEFGEEEGVSDKDVLRISCMARPASTDTLNPLMFDDKRIVGIRLYYTHSEEGFETFWNLGLIDFANGFIKANTVLTIDDTSGNESHAIWNDNSSIHAESVRLFDSPNDYIEWKSMPKLETFESINGYSPYNSTISVRYKAHCIAGRRSFVGNLMINENGIDRFYNDRMIVSPINLLDTYPYPDNVLDLDISDGDEITALSSVGDKVLQFKKNMMFVINISTAIPAEFFVEERHKYKGVMTSAHVTETADGVFWINSLGAYFYNGEEISNLHFNEEDPPQRRISEEEWGLFFSEKSLVGYNPKSMECFVIKSHTGDILDSGDCFIYSFISKSWTKGKNRFYNGSGNICTNLLNVGSDSVLSYIYDGYIGDSQTESGEAE